LKTIVFSVIAIFACFCDCEGNDQLNSLEELRWKNRIFIIDDATDRIVSELRSNRKGIEERHVYWFCIVGDSVATNFSGDIGKEFIRHLKTAYFEKYDHPVILIGKDGGVKSKDDHLDITDYFGQIDAMPMRQSEMRE